MGERAFSQTQELNVQYCFVLETLKLVQNAICKLSRFRGLHTCLFPLQIHRYSAVSGRQSFPICSFLTLNYGCVYCTLLHALFRLFSLGEDF